MTIEKHIKKKLRSFLARSIFSNRFDLIIETCAALLGFVLFIICGIFMALWGNLAGDLWPIPKDPASPWIRFPASIIFILLSVYFLAIGIKAIKKISK